MSDCLHCDIHELLESRLQDKEINLEEIAAKVTEVLADLILMVPPDQQSMLMADILVNLGNFLVEKKDEADDLLPNLPPLISRVCSGYAPDRGVLRTQLV
jgi:hypothetical protein